MTDERMALIELIEKGADADLIRDMLAFAAERLMNLEVEALTGAPAGVRSPERLNHRNGYRERAGDTRVGRIELAIPRLRKGSYWMCRKLFVSEFRLLLPEFRTGDAVFKGRQFDKSVILLCVRWYLAYNLSLRNLEEMMGVESS